MKQGFCALALIGVLVIVPAASATLFTWTGNSSSAWNANSNWNPSSGFPDDSSDTARIDVNTNGPVTFSTGTYTVASIVLNSDTNNEEAGLNVTGGSLTTTGRVSVHADDDAGSDLPARLYVVGGTFAPYQLEFVGRDASEGSHAFGAFEVDVTVGSATSSTTVLGIVHIDVTSSKVLAAKAVTVGNGMRMAELQIGFADPPGTGEFDATSLSCEVGDASGEDCVIRHTSGTLDVTGAVTLTASSSVSAEAEWRVSSGTTVTVDGVVLAGGDATAERVYLEFDADVTVGTSTGTSVTGVADADLGTNVEFVTNAFKVGDGTTAADFELLSASASTGLVQATSVVIKGGSSTASSLTVNGGKVVTQ